MQMPAQPALQAVPQPHAPYPGGQQYPGWQSYPAPAYPMQVPYPPAPRSRTGLIIGLVLGGLLLAGIIALAVAVGVASSQLDPAGPWHTYRNEAAGFEVEFPVAPTVDSETVDTDLGRRTVNSAHCMVYFTRFDVAWFDLGSGSPSEYIYDYDEAAGEVAQDFDGRVVSRERRQFGAHSGLLVKVADSQELYASVLMLRIGNRVYLVAVENYELDEQPVADRFIDGFKLLNAGSQDPWRAYRTVGNSWTHRTEIKTLDLKLVSYVRYDVLSVSDDSAKVRITNFDDDMKQTNQNDMDMKFHVNQGPSGSVPDLKTVREEIHVAAGPFDTDVTSFEGGSTWVCRKTGLMVKTETEQVLIELTEYKVK
jgi:hypothetical protein